MVKSRYIGDGHPTFNRNPYNGYINPYGIGLMTIPYYMKTMGVLTLAHMVTKTSLTRFSAGKMNGKLIQVPSCRQAVFRYREVNSFHQHVRSGT